MNTDTNPCWYIVTENEQYYELSKCLLKDATLTSVVVEELLYQIYWNRLEGGDTLFRKDSLRDSAVRNILSLYAEGYLNDNNRDLMAYALDIFRYRRLDWIDSYLIARSILYREPFGTFDSGMLKTHRIIKDSNNRIPVITGYTLPVDNLPAHVFVGDEDKKAFIRGGLLHLEDL